MKLQKQKHRGNITMNSRVPATQLFILPMELDLVLSVLSYTGLENTEVLWTLVFVSALKEVKSSPLISSFFVAIQLLVHVIFYPNTVISRCFIFQSTFFFFFIFIFGTTLFFVSWLFRVHMCKGSSHEVRCVPGHRKPGHHTCAQAPFQRDLWHGVRQRESSKMEAARLSLWRVFQ